MLNVRVRAFVALKILAVAGLVVLQPVVAQAAGRGASRYGKLDRDLQVAADRGEGGVRRVIVQTRSDADRAALKKALQAHGDIVDADHPSLNALTVRLHAKDLEALSLDPSVTDVSTDAEVTVSGVGPRKYRLYRRQNGRRATAGLRETLGVDTLSLTGAGIGIAVIDSGIDPNADLSDNIKGFWDFTKNGIPTRAFDEYGHGTHVAGLIASSGSLSQGDFEGVAPAVRLFGFKVLDKNGRGKASDVLRAIDFVIANRNGLGIDVINLSLGHPILESAATDPLVQAVERAARAGIVVVTAAGNVGTKKNGEIGYAGILSPGNAPSALTVGAVDTNRTAWHGDDRVASFSSRGPTWYDGFAKPDVVAPGVALVSDAPKSCELYTAYPQLTTSKGRNKFGVLSGTSMAAAVASGVTALVIEANRTAHPGSYLSPNAVKAILQYSALPVDDANGDDIEVLAQGTGEINVRGAAELASAVDLRWRNVRWTNARVNPSTFIGGDVEQWSQTVLWGSKLISNVDLTFATALLGENIVWGTLSLNGENIVWGTLAGAENVVWGTDASWAANLVWGDAALGLNLGNGNIVWGSSRLSDAENIVWGTLNGENIVWGTLRDAENIVWGTMRGEGNGENIVWGTALQLLGKGSF